MKRLEQRGEPLRSESASGAISLLDGRPRLWASLAVVATLAALPWLIGLRVNNSIEVWIDREGDPFGAYVEFLDTFGSEEYILVIYRLPAELDQGFIEQLAELRLNLDDIPGVRRVQCLSAVFSKFFGLLGLEAFRDEVRGSPFYRDFLVSDDATRGAVWIELEGREQRDRAAIVEAVRRAVLAASALGPMHLAGSPVIDEALDRGSQRSARTFFPLVFLLSGLLLLVFFQRPYGVVIPFLSAGVGIGWTLGIMGLAGRSLNMVTVTLPPLLWVLALSTSIHLLSRSRQLLAAGVDLDQALRQAMKELARPCLLSALTTALGFGSLSASSMQPVREMGLFAALGILLCLVSNFLLFPYLARRLPPVPRAATVDEHPILAALGALVRRRAKAIAVAAMLLAVPLTAALLRLRADSSVIDYFQRDAPIAVTYRQVLSGFTGPYSVEVLLDPVAGPTLATLQTVDRLSQRIAALPGVAKVVSAVDLAKKTHQRARLESPEFHQLPADEAAFAEAWGDAQTLLEDELRDFYDAQRGTLRLSVLARIMDTGGHTDLVAEIQRQLADLDPAWRPRLTGIVPLLVDMQKRLLDSQIRSFALAFLLIGPVIALLLGSLRYALLSLAPTLIPILVALGTMGLFGIALDPATVIIAGAALGIAVDDTIHFLIRYLHLRRTGAAVSPALDESLQTVGRAMVRTSTVAALGFFVLCFAEFVPLIYFGLFTGIAMLMALVADLVVLPALLYLADHDPAGHDALDDAPAAGWSAGGGDPIR